MYYSPVRRKIGLILLDRTHQHHIHMQHSSYITMLMEVDALDVLFV